MADLDDLAALERETFVGKLALSRRQLRYLLRCPRASAHVLRRDGRIAAEAVVLRRRTRRGVVARVYSLAVRAELRGRGLGRTLLTDCLAVLSAEGVRTVVLEVDPRNAPAVRLYEDLGFRFVARLPDYYAPARHAWKMRLELSPAGEAAVAAVARRLSALPCALQPAADTTAVGPVLAAEPFAHHPLLHGDEPDGNRKHEQRHNERGRERAEEKPNTDKNSDHAEVHRMP
jgi:ribosomal protein S18 acetylase RimI-like enzyme